VITLLAAAALLYLWVTYGGRVEILCIRAYRRASSAVRLYLYRRDRWTARRVGW
jgi:hypothetical protein